MINEKISHHADAARGGGQAALMQVGVIRSSLIIGCHGYSSA
jgi:hypothetical protein